MTINEQILKRLESIDSDMNQVMKEIREVKKFMPNLDIVTNQRYCEIRTENGLPLANRGLRKWFTQGCPRHDKHSVSVTEVNKWAEEHFKPKKA